jgi:hypothetical protein
MGGWTDRAHRPCAECLFGPGGIQRYSSSRPMRSKTTSARSHGRWVAWYRSIDRPYAVGLSYSGKLKILPLVGVPRGHSLQVHATNCIGGDSLKYFSRAVRPCRLFHKTPWRVPRAQPWRKPAWSHWRVSSRAQGDLVPTGSAFQTLVAFAVVTAALLSPL